MSKKRAIHLLVRFGDPYPNLETMQEHVELYEKFGYVWWGKFGIGSSKEMVSRLKEQMDKGVDTYVFLLKGNSITAKAKLTGIVGGGINTFYAAPKRMMVPEYYRNKRCSLWFKFGGFQTKNIGSIRDLRLLNDPSAKPSLRASRGLMYVTIPTVD